MNGGGTSIDGWHLTIAATDTKTCIIVLLVLIGIIGVSSLLEKKSVLSAGLNRSLVHITVGLMVSVFPFLFHNVAYAIGLGITFTILNTVSLITERSKGMHGSLHGPKQFSWGTVWFPLAFTGLCILFWEYPIVITTAMIILALADPVASSIGQRFGRVSAVLWKERKSIRGSIAFYSVTVTILLSSVAVFNTAGLTAVWILNILAIGMFITASEALSWKGSDNITVPLSAGLSIYILYYTPLANQFSIWVVVASITGLIAYNAKSLTASGAVATTLVGGLICGIGGISWAIPLYVFFISGSLLSRLSKQASNTTGRTLYQVMSNGGAAAVIAIAYLIEPSTLLYGGFLICLAGAMADTWSSEIGKYSNRPPRNIVTFKPVVTGTSGGITVLGTIAGFIGSAVLISVSANTWSNSWSMATLLVIGGMCVAVLDSFLGATIQGDEPYSGLPQLRQLRVTNNMVNAVSTGTAAVITLCVALIAL